MPDFTRIVRHGKRRAWTFIQSRAAICENDGMVRFVSVRVVLGCGIVLAPMGMALGETAPRASVDAAQTAPVATPRNQDAVAARAPDAAVPRAPVVTTPRFVIYSDFDTNLNDALISAGLARKKKEPELFHSGAEAGCFDKLPPSERAGWDGAVDYYARIISPAEWNAREQFLLRMQLVGFDAEWRTPDGTEFV